MEAKDKVFELLKGSAVAMKSAEIAVAAGLTKDEADKALKQLKKSELIFSPKNCFYQAK
ncbi:MAG: MarR family transcriptional regulator [Bacteroidales bacterium]|nr:MarR family transcriptional regulator [Bacteroidales bacterium]